MAATADWAPSTGPATKLTVNGEAGGWVTTMLLSVVSVTVKLTDWATVSRTWNAASPLLSVVPGVLAPPELNGVTVTFTLGMVGRQVTTLSGSGTPLEFRIVT